MKKMLVLCDGFGENNNATGICVRNVANEFARRGYDIYCVSGFENQPQVKGNFHFFEVKKSLFDRIKILRMSPHLWMRILFTVISFVRRILLIPYYPNSAYFRSIKYYKIAKKIIDSEKIDVVIAAYRPFEAIYALLKLKKKYGDGIFAVAYHLDLLSSPSTKNKYVRTYQKIRAKHVVENEKKCADMLVFPEAVNRFDSSSKNIYYANFPVLVEMEKQSFILPYDSDFYNIVFIGTLSEINRKTEKVLDLLDLCNNNSMKKIQWHVWGRADESVKKQMSAFSFVKYHGLLDNDKVLYALDNADFIVNVSNDLTVNMVPSKIFQYFSTKKPILNFIKNKDDASIPFFEQYGLSLNLYVGDDKNVCVEKILAFMKTKCNQIASTADDLLKKSTPSYFVDLVEKNLNA